MIVFKHGSYNFSMADTSTTIAIAKQQVMHQSSLLSYINSFYVIGILSIALAIVPLLLKEPPKDASAPIMH